MPRMRFAKSGSQMSIALPDRFDGVDHLEEVMTAPTPELVAELARASGDLIILGIGGKIGPTLARLAKRACPDKRVVGVARFSEAGLRENLTADGIECIAADLLDRDQVSALPKLPNVASKIKQRLCMASFSIDWRRRRSCRRARA